MKKIEVAITTCAGSAPGCQLVVAVQTRPAKNAGRIIAQGIRRTDPTEQPANLHSFRLREGAPKTNSAGNRELERAMRNAAGLSVFFVGWEPSPPIDSATKAREAWQRRNPTRDYYEEHRPAPRALDDIDHPEGYPEE